MSSLPLHSWGLEFPPISLEITSVLLSWKSGHRCCWEMKTEDQWARRVMVPSILRGHFHADIPGVFYAAPFPSLHPPKMLSCWMIKSHPKGRISECFSTGEAVMVLICSISPTSQIYVWPVLSQWSHRGAGHWRVEPQNTPSLSQSSAVYLSHKACHDAKTQC